MILDSSAVIAVLAGEPEASSFIAAMEAAPVRRMSAATYVETAAVVDSNRNPVLSRKFDDLMRSGEITVEPFTEAQAHIARAAYRDYGKGSRHPAQLNMGDCFSYALAVSLEEPLLFKGKDFLHTDIEPAIRNNAD